MPIIPNKNKKEMFDKMADHTMQRLDRYISQFLSDSDDNKDKWIEKISDLYNSLSPSEQDYIDFKKILQHYRDISIKKRKKLLPLLNRLNVSDELLITSDEYITFIFSPFMHELLQEKKSLKEIIEEMQMKPRDVILAVFFKLPSLSPKNKKEFLELMSTDEYNSVLGEINIILQHINKNDSQTIDLEEKIINGLGWVANNVKKNTLDSKNALFLINTIIKRKNYLFDHEIANIKTIISNSSQSIEIKGYEYQDLITRETLGILLYAKPDADTLLQIAEKMENDLPTYIEIAVKDALKIASYQGKKAYTSRDSLYEYIDTLLTNAKNLRKPNLFKNLVENLMSVITRTVGYDKKAYGIIAEHLADYEINISKIPIKIDVEELEARKMFYGIKIKKELDILLKQEEVIKGLEEVNKVINKYIPVNGNILKHYDAYRLMWKELFNVLQNQLPQMYNFFSGNTELKNFVYKQIIDYAYIRMTNPYSKFDKTLAQKIQDATEDIKDGLTIIQSIQTKTLEPDTTARVITKTLSHLGGFAMGWRLDKRIKKLYPHIVKNEFKKILAVFKFAFIDTINDKNLNIDQIFSTINRELKPEDEKLHPYLYNEK